jgi:hypothetical protein
MQRRSITRKWRAVITACGALALALPVGGWCRDGEAGPTSTGSLTIELRIPEVLEPRWRGGAEGVVHLGRADLGITSREPCVRSNINGAAFNLAVAGPSGELRRLPNVLTADTYRSGRCTPVDLVKIANLRANERVVVFLPAV